MAGFVLHKTAGDSLLVFCETVVINAYLYESHIQLQVNQLGNNESLKMKFSQLVYYLEVLVRHYVQIRGTIIGNHFLCFVYLHD
jgi:hypothetical protein